MEFPTVFKVSSVLTVTTASDLIDLLDFKTALNT